MTDSTPSTGPRGAGEPQATAHEAEGDAWESYPCDVETACKPVNAPDSMRFTARIRTISRGGMKLVVSGRFGLGVYLSVDLPGGTGLLPSTVLVHVMRVNPESGGAWSLECTFVSELSDRELEPFGAKRQTPSGPDKRAWVRFACDSLAYFQPVRATAQEKKAARVLDISAGGLGLRVPEPLEIGTLLMLECANDRGQVTLRTLAYVVRECARDGAWTVGCKFTKEFSDAAVQTFLESSQHRAASALA